MIAPGVSESLLEEIDRTSALARKLGAPVEELRAEIGRAARVEIAGHPEEAARILSEGNARASESVQSLFERRIRDLDARQSALEKDGLGKVVEGPMARLQAAAKAHRLAEAAQILADAESSVTRVAEELEALRAPLREIDALFGILERAGLDLPEERAKVKEIRSQLTDPESKRRDLGRIAQRAEELRVELREKVPASLERELDQHEDTLRPYPDDHTMAATARATHAQAIEHLEGGRLTDAAASLKELRAAIATLGPVPRPKVQPRPPEEVPTPPAGVSVAELVQTARLLAARVRALDPQSALAYEAATQIRRATDYLRARQLEEAAETLRRLMVALDETELGPPRSATP